MIVEVTDEEIKRNNWLMKHAYVDLEADELKPNEDLKEEEMKLFKKYKKELEEEWVAIKCDRDGIY